MSRANVSGTGKPVLGWSEEAKEWRDLARENFEAGEWARAKDLYLKAEKADWESQRFWKDVAFYSLSTALRCYEEHLLEEDPGLHPEYEVHAERFFKRFGSLTNVSPSRREEAKKFLAWREYYRNVGPSYFSAIERGDLDAAEQAIALAQERLDQTLAPRGAIDCWKIIWQSRRECLRARAQLLKPAEQVNMTLVADAYEAAALACVPPEGNEFSEQTRKSIMFYQHMHRSQAERWRANQLLVKSRGGYKSLTEALDHLERSADEAREAEAVGHDKDASSHLEYVSYWKLIVLERVKLLEYVERHGSEYLDAARVASEEAERLVKSIVTRVGEERIFPNRFYSVAHLTLETLWLDAIQEFAAGHSGAAGKILTTYCTELPRQFCGTWWHSNVLVRKLAACIIDKWQNDKTHCEVPFRELRSIVDEERCGAAAETIFEDISLLLRNRKKLVDTHSDVLKNWPLDATAEMLPEQEEKTLRHWSQSLPPEICTSFESSAFPGDEKFHSAWVQILGILLDYYEDPGTDILRLLRGFTKKTLTHRVLALPTFGGFSDARRSAILSFASDPRTQWSHRACLVPLISKVPLIAQVQGPIGGNWNAWPRWSRTSPGKRGFRIRIASETAQDFSSCRFWFLPAAYKKGNLPTLYLRNDTLRPCRVCGARLLTDSEIGELKRAASIQFEQKVREYLQALLPLGFTVVHKTEPETDLVIYLDNQTWLGEIKFTELPVLRTEDAESAVKQLRTRAEELGYGRPMRQVVVTNAPALPHCLFDWLTSADNGEAWQVLLKQPATTFVSKGDGEIEAILHANIGGDRVKLTADHLLSGPSRQE